MVKLPTILGSRIEAEKKAMVDELCDTLGLPDEADWATCLEVVRVRCAALSAVQAGRKWQRDRIRELEEAEPRETTQAYFPMRELGDEQD